MDAPIQVLLIEDDDPAAQAIALRLSRQTVRRFEVTRVASLEGALQRLCTGTSDVVLADLELPDAHGVQTVAELRAFRPELPVVVLTGQEDEALALEALAMGATDYLFKTEISDTSLSRSILYAIERGRCDRLRLEAQRQLEGKVRERTSEVQAALQSVVDEVRQRQEAEAALVVQREQLAAVLESIPGFVCATDDQRSITYANRMFRERFGVSEGDHCYACLYRREQPCDDCALERPDGSGSVRERLLADGRWYEVHNLRDRAHEGAPLRLIMGWDLTERRAQEAALLDSERRFRALFEDVSEAVMILRGDRFVDANPATLVLFGCADKEEFVGTSPADFSPERQPDGRASIEAAEERIREAIERGSAQFEWLHCRLDRTPFDAEVRLSPLELGGELHVQAVVRDITQRRRAEEDRRLLAAAVEHAAEAIVITDTEGTIQYTNPAFERVTGYSAKEAVGQNPRILKSGKHDRGFYEALWGTIGGGAVWKGYLINKRKDGQLFEEHATISPVLDEAGQVAYFVAVKRDITEQRRIEQRLNQSQKLEAIGQLAAGIAHEINTPMQFIGDNARFMQDAWRDIAAVFSVVGELVADQGCAERPDTIERLRQACEKADMTYLESEVPVALEQSLDGVARVTRIVRSMKEFAHPGGDEMSVVDLNKAVESTVTVCRNEWKYVADLDLDLDPNLPLVPCVLGDINQVVLNLITNAAHAIADVVGEGGVEKGRITVATRGHDGYAEIRVSDTGSGIPEQVRDRLFDPFFTTKEVGRGTGQGLAIAHAVVVETHKGEISFETEVGRGTTFVVRLPAKAETPTGG